MERVLAHAGFPEAGVQNPFNDEHTTLLVAIYLLGWMAMFVANIGVYRAASERAAARISLLMAAGLVGFLALVARRRRYARQLRRELVSGAAAGNEA